MSNLLDVNGNELIGGTSELFSAQWTIDAPVRETDDALVPGMSALGTAGSGFLAGFAGLQVEANITFGGDLGGTIGGCGCPVCSDDRSDRSGVTNPTSVVPAGVRLARRRSRGASRRLQTI